MKSVVAESLNPSGESYKKILGYFFPELITTLILYSVLNLWDAKLIANLQQTSMYATLGVTDTLIHLIIKIAEGLSVGTVIVCGQYNGRGDFKNVGISAVSSFWTTFVIGAVVSMGLYFGAPQIYAWYKVPEAIALLGIPFLKTRALGILFMFMYFSLIGFLRGIKNTHLPMIFFMIGGACFMFFDWALITGAFGFPKMQLQGSAVAFLIQYAVMAVCALVYLFASPTFRAYTLRLFAPVHLKISREIITLSLPVMVDKATLAIAKIWLIRMLASAGQIALASFTTVKNLEHLAFVPAMAFAPIITFLVSNDVGVQNWLGVKSNIKKVMILATAFVAVILLFFSLNAHLLMGFFDHKKEFVDFAARAFPMISVLVFFDLVQLILSAALRGAGDVRSVMVVRLIATLFFFVPVSWLFAHIPLDHALIKFILVYGSFYLSNGVMSLMYIKRLSGQQWHHRLSSKLN